MYFDYLPGDLIGGDNIFDINYTCVIVRAVWNMRRNRYDTLFYGGPYDFDGDEKSIIWVDDFSQAVCFNDVAICVDLTLKIAVFYPDVCCESATIRSSYYEY